jgi:hypothetical protein
LGPYRVVLRPYRKRPETAFELRVCRVDALVGALGYRAVSVTRKRNDGDTEWIPPSHLDYGQPRTNTVHHPEELLREEGEGEDSG